MTGRRRWARLVMVIAAAGACLAAAACSDDPPDPDRPATTDGAAPVVLDRFTETGFVDADEPAAMALAPDGSLLVGELGTGRILSISAEELTGARPASTELATLEVATEGQQGLVGLVVLPDGTVLAGLTRPSPGEPRQVVVRVVPGAEPEPVWIGPAAADDAIGGRLALLPDGRVLIGLGDFLRGGADDFGPDEPFSKLLSLDPVGPPDQTPVVVSEGWNNPFAFTVGPDGAVWVADNAPGDTPERIGRGDGGGPVVDVEVERAPSGLAVLGTGILAAGDLAAGESGVDGAGAGPEVTVLAVCGFISGTLDLVPVLDGVPGEPTARLEGPCRLGVLALPDGRLAVAVEDGVRLLAPLPR